MGQTYVDGLGMNHCGPGGGGVEQQLHVFSSLDLSRLRAVLDFGSRLKEKIGEEVHNLTSPPARWLWP